jgi:glycosyltransferase involved in cell wall biosynthesis
VRRFVHMRIAFDARSYFMRTGIARYTRGLLHALVEARPPHELLVLISNHHRPDELLLNAPDVDVRVSRAPWLAGRCEREVLEQEVHSWGADVYHAVFPPHALARVRTVTTVFDLSPLSHPTLHTPEVVSAFSEAWETAASLSRVFVAGSRATRDRVTERVGADRPVFVAGGGVSPPFDVAAPGPQDGLKRFGVLFVGTVEPRKNIALLLEAMRGLPDDVRGELTLVGKRGWGYEQFESDLARTPGARWLGYVTDEQLLQCCRSAAVVALPSRLEGIGLPLVEAMAQGALPLVSDDPALAELVDRPELRLASDARQWTAALAYWLGHPDDRAQLTHTTEALARTFTWERSARSVLRAFDEAA